MSYAELIAEYIRKSGKTLDQIADECSRKGIRVHPTYISKLRLAKRPAASEEISRAIAEVTGGDPEELIRVGYMESLPDEKRRIIEDNLKLNYEGLKAIAEVVLRETSDANGEFLDEGFKTEVADLMLKHAKMFAGKSLNSSAIREMLVSDKFDIEQKNEFVGSLAFAFKRHQAQQIRDRYHLPPDRDLKFLIEESDEELTYNNSLVTPSDKQLLSQYLEALFKDRMASKNN